MKHPHVLDLFHRNVTEIPNAIALKENGKEWDYQTLHHKKEVLTQKLELAVFKTDLCFIISDQTSEVVQAMLAIMGMGKIFVPISTKTPATRFQDLLEHYTPDCVLIGKEVDSKSLSNHFSSQVQVDGFSLFYTKTEAKNTLPCQLDYQNVEAPCYLYFTSGSTGTPKGILGNFKGINHFIDWETNYLQLKKGLQVSQFSAPTFDAFLRDVFIPLTLGGTICVPPKDQGVVMLEALPDWFTEMDLTLMHVVPSVIRNMLEMPFQSEALSNLKYLLFSGEALFSSDIVNWQQVFGTSAALYNLYGPSETTMVKFVYPIDPVQDLTKEPSIGKPINGCKAILLDEHLHPCPQGNLGELYIRTPYRSLGYYKAVELTNQSFIPNPFSNDAADLLYKTGDFAIQKADGNYEFKGRKDQQIKFNGVRIELTEIEHALHEHSAIQEAVVLMLKDKKQLCACIHAKGALTEQEVKQHVEQYLPAQSWPTYYFFFDRFAKTPSGKVDRKNLRKQVVQHLKFLVKPMEEPTTNTEKQLVQMWQEVLSLDKISIHDNFFAIGGNSLKSTQLASRIKKVWNKEVRAADIFRNPTLYELALVVDQKDQLDSDTSTVPVLQKQEYYAVSNIQKRMWMGEKIHQTKRRNNRPVFIKIDHQLEFSILKNAFLHVITENEILRTKFTAEEGEPVQKIQDSIETEGLIELHKLDASISKKDLEYHLLQLSNEHFVIDQWPLMKLKLVNVGSHLSYLVLNMHHIVTDGWSSLKFCHEIWRWYATLEKEPNAEPTIRQMQYKECVAWLHSWGTSSAAKKSQEYWSSELNTEWHPGVLPYDFEQGNSPSINLEQHQAKTSLVQLVSDWEQTSKESTFALLFAALNLVIYRYSGMKNILLGTVTAGRVRPEFEVQLGPFINTLPLVSHILESMELGTFLTETNAKVLAMNDHQSLPYERIIEGIPVQPQGLLFRTGLVYHNHLDKTEDAPFEQIYPDANAPQHRELPVDLWITVEKSSTGMSFSLIYDKHLYQKTTMDRFMKDLSEVVQQIIEQPKKTINQINISSEENFKSEAPFEIELEF